VAHQYLHWKYH